MADTFNTTELEAALPRSGEEHKGNGHAIGSAQPDFEKQGWAKGESYNYDMDAQNVGFEGNAKVYEWVGEFGEVGPKHPELELALFGTEEDRKAIRGIDFSTISGVNVTQEGPYRVNPIHSFKDAGLHPAMLENVELSGYTVPTPIQKYCLPAVHLGYDVIGIAQTGSGKTAAYMIPILNKLMGKAKKLAAPRPNPADLEGMHASVRAEPLVVVVCPTRELAVQIFNEARKFCYRTMLRPGVVYGGCPIRDQVGQLGKGCDVLVATPGRLVDFIHRPDILTLRRVRYMVIDEADEMLHDDWQHEFQQILTGGEQDEGNVKYMLFSATFPKGARDLAKTYLDASHVRLRVGRAGSTVANIKQVVMQVELPQKKPAVLALLSSLPPCRTIIFVNSKFMADELDDFLFNTGLPCTAMHGDRTQLEREASMRAFRAGKNPILIATGISARGIDVRGVQHVINFDLPSMDHGGIEEYTHRIGRTGRIGHRGLATSFYTDRDAPIASVLTRTLLETGQEIPDFLEQFKPQSDTLKFETESDWDEHEAAMTGATGGGEAWGNDGNERNDAWGSGGDSAANTAAPSFNTAGTADENAQVPATPASDAFATPDPYSAPTNESFKAEADPWPSNNAPSPTAW